MTHHVKHHLSPFQGALIVLGTSVGGGMLGLPVMTASSGFLPSCSMIAVSWFFMTLTGLVLAELSCRMKRNANLLSLYSEAFPKAGSVLSVAVYFILFYSLMVAYILALGRFLSDALGAALPCSISPAYMTAIVAATGALIVFSMRSWLSRVNSFLVLIMATTYALFVMFSEDLVETSRLHEADWRQAWSSLPLIFTSFGFQGTVPSLASLMGYERKSIFSSILWGTSLTLVVYICWQAVIMGAIPMNGYMGLRFAQVEGLDAVTPLAFHLADSTSSYIIALSKIFAFAAVATSLLGVSLGVHDFIADLFRVQHKTPTKRVLLVAASFVPAGIFSVLYPSAFLQALSVAGGIGCAFLLGVMPSLTAYVTSSQEGEAAAASGTREKVLQWVMHPWPLLLAAIFFAVEVMYECYILASRW